MKSRHEAPLDHLIYGVTDLATGVEALEDLFGLRASPGGSHPGWGTANALFSLGPKTYLEVIGPDPSRGEPATPRPFGLDELKSPGLVGWAVPMPNIDEGVRRSRTRGYDPGPVRSMSRKRPDGSELSWRLALPGSWASTHRGLVPFPIDWGQTPHPGGQTVSGLRLVRLSGRHREPDRVKATLSKLGASLAVESGEPAGLEAALETPRGRVILGPAEAPEISNCHNGEARR